MAHGRVVTVLVVAFAAIFAGGMLWGATTDDLVFIHHSSGQNWLTNSLDAALVAKDYIDERNDIYYGTDVTPDAGRPDSLGPVPGDCTNMNHWLPWFNDYLSAIKTTGVATGVNRIVMFKSCFPISDVAADGASPGDPFSSTQTIANYQAVYRNVNGAGSTYTRNSYSYLALQEIFAANPDTLFIPVTAPPLSNPSTTDANAHRARLFNEWLTTDWLGAYNAAHPGLNNVAVFDWFDLLANPDNAASYPNRLRAAYGGTNSDSHPNSAGNAYSTQLFATNAKNFIDEAWERFVYDPGDANGDGLVDGGDLAIWQQNYDPRGTNAATNRWVLGDWNGDGKVDGGDLALWQQNYDPLGVIGKSAGVSASLDTQSVPEPTSILLAVTSAAAGLLVRRRRRG